MLTVSKCVENVQATQPQATGIGDNPILLADACPLELHRRLPTVDYCQFFYHTNLHLSIYRCIHTLFWPELNVACSILCALPA
ncbi:hypothetical protein PISMIDRAFT_679148 [Pisolithus microcarpus 441]|uniref:Uncharacterized protein n=1 Tax=Pisolithus microcarpus 441 TaxID=765257 RepID=A0A0C9ZVJ0_9AGAM|nr:hypothetical protein PISMIDRAFT_679148 [Pisolithus microcarpus 441]